MRALAKLFLFTVVSILISCNNGKLSKKDAERSLKVLNSDMINFGAELNEATEMKALEFVMSAPENPFPVYKNTNRFISTKTFDFSQWHGIYEWSDYEKLFKKTGDSKNIILQIDNSELKDISIIINDYQTEKVSSGEPFPKVCQIEITQNKKTIWEFDFTSKISNNLPEDLKLRIKGESYQVNANLKRTTNGDSGKLFVDFTFKYLLKTLIKSKLDCNIGYSRQGYYFKQLKLDQLLFGHHLAGDIDYAKVDPTAQDYAASFNENSNLELFENGRGKVGDLILATVENDELVDYHIQFTDKSKALLGSYLPVFNKFINLKY
ncbi:hypothetical protein [uncultured Draconibacterium sp.]|uniref:hypothetical protein n=1 Tax=uncultured Draconibacterium sp. TaxID=1573823 RepID=UPI0029C7F562|nr:hypothetical protein [uncultured Draconibacterium sp.]